MTDKARIRRATAIAHRAVERLDAEVTDALIWLYRDQAADIAARIRAHAVPDNGVSLQGLRSLLDQVEGILRRLTAQRDALLTEAMTAAVEYGTRPLLGAVTVSGAMISSAASMRVADEALRFAQTFIAEDGLQLSDRLWRIDRGARDALVNALESAIIQGHGATQAARELLARGQAVPDNISGRLGMAGADALATRAADLMTGEGGAEFQAQRLFRTEINRAHGEAYMMSGADHPDFAGWRFLLSPAHPEPDICDLLSEQNLYGLGPGVYPDRESCPWPAHPNTLSFVQIVFKDEISEADRAGKETPMQALGRLSGDRREGVLGKGKTELYNRGMLTQGMIRAPLRDAVGRARDAGVLPTPKTAYDEATQPGGRHHGWYLRQTELSEAELSKAIRSFERQIEKHTGWLADPTTKLASFYDERVERQRALTAGWQQDIDRHREFIDILRGVLKGRNHG